MHSQFFPQHLLNCGRLSLDEMKDLLEKSVFAKPCLQLLALHEKYMTPEQLTPMKEMSELEFATGAVEKGYLNSSQIKELQAAVPGKSLSFAQVLLQEDIMSYEELAKEFDHYAEETESPVKAALKNLEMEELENEMESYTDYAEMFIRLLSTFLDIPVVINLHEPFIDTAIPSHIVSQAMVGDVSFVAGIYASDDVFLELARRYSNESLTEINDMAVDSVTEFLNVLNGLYAVELAKEELDIDLDIPRTAEHQEPMGYQQLVVGIQTGFGLFLLVLAADEFICA